MYSRHFLFWVQEIQHWQGLGKAAWELWFWMSKLLLTAYAQFPGLRKLSPQGHCPEEWGSAEGRVSLSHPTALTAAKADTKVPRTEGRWTKQWIQAGVRKEKNHIRAVFGWKVALYPVALGRKQRSIQRHTAARNNSKIALLDYNVPIFQI